MAAEHSFDLVIVGAGPGGYVCTFRAAQLGLKTALVEKEKTLGGTCLNIGCIPSKALLHSTEIFHFVREKGKAHGFDGSSLDLDLPALLKKKDEVVKKLVGGVGQLAKGHGVTVFEGTGKLAGKGKVTVEGKDKATLSAKHIVFATGSVPVELPFLKFDGKTIVSSTEALSFDKVPENLVVVGGGAIGLELGSVWARLGSKVSVLEFLPQIAPTFDDDLCKMAQRIFKKQGLAIHTQTKVTGYDAKKGEVTAEDKGGKEQRFPADKVLVCVGRKPFTANLGLEEAGVELDEKGRVKTDAHWKTSVEGVYAIGDIVSGPMLAHKAEDEGVALAEQLSGGYGHVNYEAIPNVIYTEPEIASVGHSEQSAQEAGFEVRTGSFPVAANGRAIASDATDGLVKIIAEKKSDRLLGVQVICKGASELIAAAVAHMEYGGSAEDLARTVHAHPTMSESMKEAALALDGRALHSLK